jgi:hypothetical protein
MKMRSKLPAVEGRRLTTELTVHNNDFGGVTAVIYGSKGSGKTTLFLTLCQTIQCYNLINGNLEFETSVWRGGDEDYWTWLPYERTRVFIHRDNIDTVSFKCDENLLEYDRSQLPQIIVYKNNIDLYSKLLRGGINVVYEPTTYTLTDRLKKMIQRRGVAGDELFKKKEVDPIIWWFEFIDWLRVNKSLEHISVFIDEADQLLPVSPSGARWHLNLWFKDIMRALRKRNISLFMACHGYTDIDGRMRPKIMYRIYMKGACSPSESLIWKTAPITLPQGKYYIERDAWGWARFNKIDEQPRVLVTLKRDAVDDEINDMESSGKSIINQLSTVINQLPEPTKTIQSPDIMKTLEVVFPVGVEDLPIKFDRKPGEFIPITALDTPYVKPNVITGNPVNQPEPVSQIIESAAPINSNPEIVGNDDESMRSDENEQSEYVSPSLEDLLDPAEDKYKPSNKKSDDMDPLKDLYDEE